MSSRVGLVLLSVLALATAHSWLDCVDWRFNDPNVRKYRDSDGQCFGYARRWPVDRLVYGAYDGFRYYRHYLQDPTRQNSDNKPPCSQFTQLGSDGRTLVGSDERRSSPINSAYAPNRDPDNYPLGEMAVVRPGQEICMRWPAKNHAGHVNNQNMVFINWATQPGVDPTQEQLNTMTVAELRYRNCPDPGVPASSDQTGAGSDRMPCGGCFTVPDRAPGNYLVQWRWMLNPGEWYTSCADVQVETNTPTTSQATTSEPTQSTTTKPPAGERPEIIVVVTISLDVDVLQFDAEQFVVDVTDLLNIPPNAVRRVEVNLDSSSSTPPKTLLTFHLVNVDGYDGTPVNPIKKASELKEFSLIDDKSIAGEYGLNGLQVLGADEVAAAPAVFASAVLVAFATLLVLV